MVTIRGGVTRKKANAIHMAATVSATAPITPTRRYRRAARAEYLPVIYHILAGRNNALW
jgi:hypothetical protein